MSSKIVKNSLFLYLRMILLLGIGFFTSRKILEALGVSDLGIFNVVGSFILMFDFVSSGLTNSTQRFLNIGLGKNDADLTRQYFSQSLTLHLCFGLLMVTTVEIVGTWFVSSKLVLPENRINAALIVFHLSVAMLFLKMVRICFESNVIARECMSVYAYLSIFEGAAKLFICYVLISNNTCDKLIFYGTLLLLLNFSVTCFYVVFCLIKFPESRFKFYKDKTVYKQLLSFVGVNSFGVISWAVGKQGLNVVMNMFLGPAINGAKALAAQLDQIVTQFGSNADLAIRPQITKLAAQNKYDEMILLAMKSTKYIFFVMLIVGSPLFFETESLLSIWLGNVPEFTSVFVKILLFEEMFNVMGKPFNGVSIAIGKIKTIQVYGRMITLAVLPLSYIILCYCPNPIFPVVLLVVLTFAYSLFIVFNMNTFLKFGMKSFFKNVLGPIFLVTLISFSLGYVVENVICFESEMISLCVKIPILLLVPLLISYFFGLNFEERSQLNSMLLKFIKR